VTDKEYKKLIKRKAHYMLHSWMCAVRGLKKNQPCDCGLTELQADVGKALKTKKKGKKNERKTAK